MNRGPISIRFPPREARRKQLTFFNAFSVDGAWSADGQSVAFASTEGGKARVWVVNADGSAPRPLSAGDMSETFDVTWAPGARILYQQTGNRNFYVSIRGAAGTAADQGQFGWLERVGRVLARRKADCGVMEPAAGSRRLGPSTPRTRANVWSTAARHRHESMPVPIGWSPDGRFIIAVDGKRAAYRGVTASFEETLTDAKILRLPWTAGRRDAPAAAFRRSRQRRDVSRWTTVRRQRVFIAIRCVGRGRLRCDVSIKNVAAHEVQLASAALSCERETTPGRDAAPAADALGRSRGLLICVSDLPLSRR